MGLGNPTKKSQVKKGVKKQQNNKGRFILFGIIKSIISTPAACDLVQLPTGTARSNAIESGMWLIHKPPRFSALIEHAAPSLRIPMASSPHAPWVDLHRSADAPPLPPGAAAIDWSKNRFRGAMVNEAALWLRTFHDSY